MNLYKQFQTAQDLETNGIVLNYGKNDKKKDIDIRVARAGGANTKFNRVAEQVLKPYRRQIANESIDVAVLDGLFRIIYARAVVLGWSGVEDADGNAMEFNEENCVKLFTDLPDLFNDIRSQCDKAALFKKDALEDEAKNSQTS